MRRWRPVRCWGRAATRCAASRKRGTRVVLDGAGVRRARSSAPTARTRWCVKALGEPPNGPPVTWRSPSAATRPPRRARSSSASSPPRGEMAGVRVGLPDRGRHRQHRLRRGPARPSRSYPRAPAGPAGGAAARRRRRRRRPGCARTTCRCRPADQRRPGGRLLLAGDALSLINPFTGEGIFYAVLVRRPGRCGRGRTPPGTRPGRRYAAAFRGRLGGPPCGTAR